MATGILGTGEAGWVCECTVLGVRAEDSEKKDEMSVLVGHIHTDDAALVTRSNRTWAPREPGN